MFTRLTIFTFILALITVHVKPVKASDDLPPMTVGLYEANSTAMDCATANYTRSLLEHLGKKNNWNFEFKTADNNLSHGFNAQTTVDIYASVFKNDTLAPKYKILGQPIGYINISLYSPHHNVKSFRVPPRQWSEITVAYLPGVLSCYNHFTKFAEQNFLTYNLYPFNSIDECIEAVNSGSVDMLLLASYQPPDDLYEIANLGIFPYYMAVSRGLHDVYNQLKTTLEYTKVYEQDFLDSIAEKWLRQQPSPNRVRVAIFSENGLYTPLPSGESSGAYWEALKRINSFTQWDIDTVHCSFNDALKYLKEKRIDVVGNVVHSEEREKQFSFLPLASGTSQLYLFAKNDSPYDSEFPATWHSLNIAVPNDEVTISILKEYLDNYDLQYKLTTYSSMRQATDAFFLGECNTVVSSTSAALQEHKVLLTFPPTPTYFCCQKENKALHDTLTLAIAQINAHEPDYFNSLYQKYFPRISNVTIAFTTDELAWMNKYVNSGTPIVIDLSPLVPPLKTFDSDHITATGFTARLLEYVSKHTGLSFRYVPPANSENAVANLTSGVADLWADYGANKVHNNDLHVVSDITIPQVSTQIRSNITLSKYNSKIAVLRDDFKRIEAYSKIGLRNQLVFCSSVDECFHAVMMGKAHIFFSSTYAAQFYIKKLKAEKLLESRPLLNPQYEVKFTFTAGPHTPPQLTSIMKKCISSISEEQMQNMLYTSVTENMKYSIITTANILTIISAIIVLASIIITIQAYNSKQKLSDAYAKIKAALEAGERASKAKSLFFATVSHDIRTPLNTIIGYSQLLKMGVENEEVSKKYLDSIVFSGNTLMELINDVLDISKLEAGKMQFNLQRSDFNVLASKLIQTFKPQTDQKGISIKIDAEPIPQIEIDQQRIRQIIFNLIGNAVKFTSHGGITFKYSFDRHPNRKGCLMFSVTDTGIGIPPQYVDKLMQPFVQVQSSSKGGTGLGLAICKQMVENMGGNMQIDSVEGVGSTFSVVIDNIVFYVDTIDLASTSTQIRLLAVSSKVEDMEILIVDDSPLNLNVLSAMLTKLGVKHITKASSGAEALEILHQKEIELVLTDLWMPKMSGAELAMNIRQDEKLKNLDVFAITADVEMQKSYEEHGFTGIILKPLKLENLEQLLNR